MAQIQVKQYQSVSKLSSTFSLKCNFHDLLTTVFKYVVSGQLSNLHTVFRHSKQSCGVCTDIEFSLYPDTVIHTCRKEGSTAAGVCFRLGTVIRTCRK